MTSINKPMKSAIVNKFVLVVLTVLGGMPCHAQWKYPPTKTVEASDTYFGKTYKDPYRWLENMKDPDVEAWFKVQGELTDGLLAKIPGRDALAEEWMALDKLKPAEYGAITCEHRRVFYKKTLGGENVGKLFCREGWAGAERQIFDPAGYKADVTTTIQSAVPSWDGKYVALGFSSGGAEYSEIRVLEVERGTLLPESIYPSYGAYGWLRDSKSFFNSVATRGVVLAFAHPRGGSEKGEAWYKAGYKTTKPNTWKDFISCAEYLVKKGYTSPQKLGGTGTSAGGILISRAITERPDLFGAAVCNVGCANAMRMEFSPNGPVNTPEFGTVNDAVECQALFEMDGVQHVRKGVNYPAVMGVGGWNDPRVTAWEPGKFVAAMQEATASGNPVLMKVNYDNGHFTEEKIVTFKNFAGQFAFLLWQTGHKDFQPVKQ